MSLTRKMHIPHGIRLEFDCSESRKFLPNFDWWSHR